MNYRHIYHAGNFADVMKHAFLARILLHLAAKGAPFRVIDTHAGIGAYNLAAEAPNRTGEWRDGVDRLLRGAIPPPVAEVLKPYLDCVLPSMQGEKPIYPGSPALIQALTRTQDRMTFVEKHPQDVRALKAFSAGDRRIKVLELDGWLAWKAQTPPPEKRGLVLVDPPFEEGADFGRLVEGLTAAHRRWATGTSLLWYPVKDQAAIGAMVEDLRATGIRKVLRLELQVDRPDAEGPLAGSGLIVVNPPWTLLAEAQTLLPWLAKRLARGSGTGWLAEWVTPE